jgi:hypothetical protein
MGGENTKGKGEAARAPAALALAALLLAAAAAGAQEAPEAAEAVAEAAAVEAEAVGTAPAAGSWAVTGWTRANFGWDFENEKQLPKPDGDWDATGAAATLSYTKGPWKVEGTAEVTSGDFGTTYGASGNIKTTYAAGDWTVYGKLAQTFNEDGQYKWVDDPAVDGDGDGNFTNDKDNLVKLPNAGRTAQFSVENWKQDANNWGIKGVVQLKLNGGMGVNGEVSGLFDWPLPVYDPESGDNKAAFFINFWDRQILLEGGYGDYTGTVWGTPGPYELQYESADDKDSVLRLQFKPAFLPGLNLGFAYLPAPGHNAVNAGLADSKPKSLGDSSSGTITGFGAWKPVDAIRATTFGAKYAPADGPLTVAAGFNVKEDAEKGYAGFSFKLLDKRLTFYLDTQAQHSGGFGVFDLGEKLVFVDNPDAAKLELGLTLKENRLVRSSGGTSAKDFEFVVSPWVWYEFIDKTARAKLALDLTKGLGEVNEDHTAWSLAATLGWSIKESPALDPDDIGTGFVAKYKVGTAWDPYTVDKGVASGETITNQLYFGFKASF